MTVVVRHLRVGAGEAAVVVRILLGGAFLACHPLSPLPCFDGRGSSW